MDEVMNNEEEFLLKWNNHQSNLIGVFKEWLRDESFVDVTLVCGGEAVSGHKVVLAACSPLLNRILHDNPCQHPVVILNDVCSTDMKAILKFIYQGEVSVSQSELPSFLRTADNLQIKGLAEGREKEEKKRKEKDDSSAGGVKKKRKAEFQKISSSQQSTNSAHQEVVTSSPKSQTHFITNKHSSLNSHQHHHTVGIASSTSNQISNINTQVVDAEINKFSVHQVMKDEEIGNMVVKTEPLDYAGEMVWQEGNALIKRENTGQEEFVSTLNNASSSNSHNSLTYSTSLPFGVLATPLENLGNSSGTTDFLQKNIESIQTEEKRIEDECKSVTVGNEDLIQTTMAANYEEMNEEETLNMGSPGKFRGGRKPCCFCGKTFCDNYTLRRHMVTHLSRQRQFECSLCSAAYSRKDHLMAHMRRKHPGTEYETEGSSKVSQPQALS